MRAKQKRTSVGYAFIDVGSGGGIEKGYLSLFQAIKRGWSERVGRLVGMDQERESPVLGFYLRVRGARKEVENRVATGRVRMVGL